MDIFVRHVAEMFNSPPPDPDRNKFTSEWTIDYSFTPGWIRIGDGPWERRKTDAAYLIPRYKPWFEKSAGAGRIQSHKVQLLFQTCHNKLIEDVHLDGRRLQYLLLLDPDRVVANTMVEIASTARTLMTDGYWTVHRMVWDFLQVLLKAKTVADGVREVRSSDMGTPMDPVVTRALAFLQQHMSEPLAIGTVARHLNMGASTLSHRFKLALGHGPMKELQRLRILRAKALLRQHWKLAAIARETGFCDGFHLSRVFKQSEGISPSQFAGTVPSDQ